MATTTASAGEMRQSDALREPTEPGFGAWLGFWAQLAVLGALAVYGAVFASRDEEAGDYACGLILSLSALALAFLRIKDRFDGGPALGWGSFLLVDDMANLVAVVVIFTLLALGGLVIAAGIGHGGLHDAGLALFVACGIAIFLSLKHVFDNLDHRR